MSEFAQLRGQIECWRETLKHLADEEEAKSSVFEIDVKAVN